MTDAITDPVTALIESEKIKRVIVDYAYTLDQGDWDSLRACFTKDAAIVGSIDTLPIDEVLPRSRRLMELYSGNAHYINTQRVSELTATTAVVESYLIACHFAGETPGLPHPDNLVAGGRYRDEMAIEDGQWRIRRRTVFRIWNRGSLPEEMRQKHQQPADESGD